MEHCRNIIVLLILVLLINQEGPKLDHMTHPIIVNSASFSTYRSCIAHDMVTQFYDGITLTSEAKHQRLAALAYLAMFLITISNDINISHTESNYRCGTCDKPVTWDDRGIVCDTCN